MKSQQPQDRYHHHILPPITVTNHDKCVNTILLNKLKIYSSNSCNCLLIVILLLVTTSSSLLPTATALSTSSSSSSKPPPPPPRSSIPTTSQKVSNTQCRILLDIGRVTGTAMPPEWAASGARLVLPDVDLRFEEKVYRYGYSENEERLLGYGYDPPPLQVEVLSLPKFVGTKGEETVQITKGGYALKSSPEGDDRWPGIAFRFFLDFPDGAIRNDVTLPAERVFFTTKCWVDDSSTTTPATGNSNRKGEFQSAMDRLRTTKEEYERIGNEILNWDEKEQQEEEEVQRAAAATTNNNGKKRDTDGGGGGIFGMFRRATGFRSRVQLSERKTILKRRVEIMERALPPLSSLDGDGKEKGENTVVRSSDGVIFEKEGYMTVKRYGGLLGAREEYHIVGKFMITEILDSTI